MLPSPGLWSIYRLRFDFTHFEGIAPEGIKQLEETVNSYIWPICLSWRRKCRWLKRKN